MKTNKKVQKNSVQKSEKENAVKVTALAVIPKPIMLLTPQDVPTATEVTAPPRNGNRSHRYRRNTAAGHVQDTACNGHSRNRP